MRLSVKNGPKKSWSWLNLAEVLKLAPRKSAHGWSKSHQDGVFDQNSVECDSAVHQETLYIYIYRLRTLSFFHRWVRIIHMAACPLIQLAGELLLQDATEDAAKCCWTCCPNRNSPVPPPIFTSISIFHLERRNHQTLSGMPELRKSFAWLRSVAKKLATFNTCLRESSEIIFMYCNAITSCTYISIIFMDAHLPRLRHNSESSVAWITNVAPPLLREPRSRARRWGVEETGNFKAASSDLNLVLRVCELYGHRRSPPGSRPKAMSTTAIRSGLSIFADWCRAWVKRLFGSRIDKRP